MSYHKLYLKARDEAFSLGFRGTELTDIVSNVIIEAIDMVETGQSSIQDIMSIEKLIKDNVVLMKTEEMTITSIKDVPYQSAKIVELSGGGYKKAILLIYKKSKEAAYMIDASLYSAITAILCLDDFNPKEIKIGNTIPVKIDSVGDYIYDVNGSHPLELMWYLVESGNYLDSVLKELKFIEAIDYVDEEMHKRNKENS